MAKYFSKEEIQAAKEANLVDVIGDCGYSLLKKGNYFFLPDHDSFCIFPETNSWFWFSQNYGGNVIDFFIKGPYEVYSFTAAVDLILNSIGKSSIGALQQLKAQPKNEENKEIILIPPPRAGNNKRAIAYLVQKRQIDYQIVMRCIKAGKLYETAQTHNAAFVGYDDRKIKHIFLRGTTDNRFAGDCEGSDKRFGFKIEGNSQALHVFESPIDLLSYLTIKKLNNEEYRDTYISLSGVSPAAAEMFLSNNTVKKIYVRTDNDTAGRKAYLKLKTMYEDNIEVIYEPPVSKDYNEDLVTGVWRMERGGEI